MTGYGNKMASTAMVTREYDGDCEPMCIPPVSEQLDRQTRICMGLLDLVSELRKRLEPVLRPEGPECNTKDSPEHTPPLCPIGSNVREHNNRLEDITSRLNTIISRLEV